MIRIADQSDSKLEEHLLTEVKKFNESFCKKPPC